MDMQALVADWARREIPVLGSTASALAALRRDEERVSGRDISRVVLRDPLMTLRVLRYAEAKRSARQPTDITTVEHAVMMHGITRFFRDFANLPVLEQVMAPDPEALQGALAVISRAQHAAAYARAMASHRADLETDEVIIGALLHDLAELLLWCHQPREAVLIRYLLDHAAGARSAGLQAIVLGFTQVDLTLALADEWRLPALLRRLMDDHHAASARVVNVVTAAALARHTAHGWSDPAIPDDLRAVQKLTSLGTEASHRLVRNAALQAASLWLSVGVRPAAALLPSTVDPDAGVAIPDSGAEVNAERFREAMARVQDAPPGTDVTALAAMTLYALHKGLGLERAAWGEVDEGAGQVTLRFALGDAQPPLRGYSTRLDAKHLFALLMQKSQGVLASGERRERLAALLDSEGRSRIGASDFLAMSLHAGDRPRALFVADLGRSGRAIPENLYPAFKAACLGFARRLQAPRGG
jgi:HD-like signal output (HDOD) protein